MLLYVVTVTVLLHVALCYSMLLLSLCYSMLLYATLFLITPCYSCYLVLCATLFTHFMLWYVLSTGSSDVILQTQNLTFLSEQPLLTSVRFSFPVDGVAQEDDETFTISYSDISPSAAFSIGTLTVMDAFSATIEDADSK